MNLCHKAYLLLVVFFLNFFGCDGANMQTMKTMIVDYRIIPLDVFLKNDDSVVSILGYRYTHEHPFHFTPVVLKSNDGGRSWILKVFPNSMDMPRFFKYSELFILYNYEQTKTRASVYISKDYGEFWNQIGEQELLNREIPVFGNLITERPEIHQISKVIADSSWYIEEEPSQTNFEIRKGEPAVTSQIGYINRLNGVSTIIDVKYDLNSTLTFVDDKHQNIWILGKVYGREAEDEDRILLLKASGNNVEKIAEWPSLADSKYGSDSPKSILVSEKIIATAAAGPFWSGPTTLRYSLDNGLSWEERALPSSTNVQLSYDSVNNKLIMALASMIYFHYIEISIEAH